MIEYVKSGHCTTHLQAMYTLVRGEILLLVDGIAVSLDKETNGMLCFFSTTSNNDGTRFFIGDELTGYDCLTKNLSNSNVLSQYSSYRHDN